MERADETDISTLSLQESNTLKASEFIWRTKIQTGSSVSTWSSKTRGSSTTPSGARWDLCRASPHTLWRQKRFRHWECKEMRRDWNWCTVVCNINFFWFFVFFHSAVIWLLDLIICIFLLMQKLSSQPFSSLTFDTDYMVRVVPFPSLMNESFFPPSFLRTNCKSRLDELDELLCN